jgi:hypothetical protein
MSILGDLANCQKTVKMIHSNQPKELRMSRVEQLPVTGHGSFENFRLRLAVAGTVGLAALSGATKTSLAEADPAIVAHQSAATYYRYSSLKPQNIINSIHRTVLPIDQEKNIQPTSAFMKSSTAGFRTDCHTHSSYKFYQVSPLGTAETPCGYGIPETQKSQFDQYQPALNKLGNLARKSVGLSGSQTVESVNGNRKKVTLTFSCPEGDQPPLQVTGVRSIALTKLRKPTRTRRSRAAITNC